MQFIVLGYDGTDEKALERRMAARAAHLKNAERMHQSGRWLYAGAILSEAGTMCGSFIVCDYPSRQALEEEWLNSEPYMVGNVWQRVEITRAQVASFCAPRP
jgi:uncharacterized protein